MRASGSLPKKKVHAGRKGRVFPCSTFLVKPKSKKNPLDLQHQYVSKCPTNTRPTPPFPGLGLSFGKMSDTAVADTRRLNSKPQDLTDAYGPPSNFLEIDIFNPQTVGVGRARFTTYEVRMRTNLPIFKLKESCVRRRYSDFEWLKNELERDSKIVVPPLPGKALKRQLPFRGDEGIFEESFIEERRQGLEQFINKIAGHPLAQNERCLHMFLQEEAIDRNYVPGKVRQ